MVATSRPTGEREKSGSGLVEVADRMSARIEEVAVVTGEADEGHLAGGGETLEERKDGEFLDTPDHVFLEQAEDDGLGVERDHRHVVVDGVLVAVDGVRR